MEAGAKGNKLGTYTYADSAYNSIGELMWKITWTKRWCYRVDSKQVVSVFYPKPEVKIYSYLDNAWKYGGITSSDAYYTTVDAKGGKHPNFPRWGHVSWYTVRMQHCALKVAMRTNTYEKVGTIAYWDGSKKLV